MLVAFPQGVLAQGEVDAEYQVKLAFLCNFAQFIQWPADAFPHARSPPVESVSQAPTPSIVGSSTLTVGETKGFADLGGVINLTVKENRLRFEINLDAAMQRPPKISSKLLALAKIVKGGTDPMNPQTLRSHLYLVLAVSRRSRCGRLSDGQAIRRHSFVWLVGAGAGKLRAQSKKPGSDLMGMSLEDLMAVQVTSVSKKEQKLSTCTGMPASTRESM
jgi:hypothetical protein